MQRWLLFVFVAALAIAFTFPFFWTVTSSLKPASEVFDFPPRMFPSVVMFSNYSEVWRRVPFFLFARNTVVITGLSMFGQVLSASLVAYGFSRFRFPGREWLFMVLISTLILPGEVTLVPTFLIFRQVDWLDTFKPLVVPAYFGGGAFSIFLFRQFFLTLPRELDEAAKMDGASSIRVYATIIAPLSKPAFATVAIFSFLGNWNDFLYPLIYLNSLENFTLSLGLRYFQQAPNTAGEVLQQYLMAGSVMMSLPCILIFFFAQRYFIQGIVMSAIKG